MLGIVSKTIEIDSLLERIFSLSLLGITQEAKGADFLLGLRLGASIRFNRFRPLGALREFLRRNGGWHPLGVKSLGEEVSLSDRFADQATSEGEESIAEKVSLEFLISKANRGADLLVLDIEHAQERARVPSSNCSS